VATTSFQAVGSKVAYGRAGKEIRQTWQVFLI